MRSTKKFSSSQPKHCIIARLSYGKDLTFMGKKVKRNVHLFHMKAQQPASAEV